MENAIILMPPSTGLSGILLSIRTFLKDQNMKKYQHVVDTRGEGLPTPHRKYEVIHRHMRIYSMPALLCFQNLSDPPFLLIIL